MGVMRFLIRPSALLDDWPEVHRAYISGLESRVYPTRVEVSGDELICRRNQSDSGRLNVAVPVPGFGRPVVATCSLCEREEPYLLLRELARGKISQVRDQLGSWEVLGMRIPSTATTALSEAHHVFAQAVSAGADADRAGRLSRDALVSACRAAELLVQDYTRQRLDVIRQRSQKLPALLGCGLSASIPTPEHSERFCGAFNYASVPICWKSIEPEEGTYEWDLNDDQVEWCREHRLLIHGGPLLDLSHDGLPEWLATWSHDFINLQSFVSDFVETAIARYAGKIRNWEVSSRGNVGGALLLDEEQRLALVARTVDVARQVDVENQLLIRISQPWAEYQAKGQHRLSALQFVDALVRSGVGLSGVNLEVNIGFDPGGSPWRDVLDFSRMLDAWGCLGIPLNVILAFPSQPGDDANAAPGRSVTCPVWKSDWSEAAQGQWLEALLPLLMSKQPVVGVAWTHFSDAVPHEFPHAGLLRADGTAKPALDTFTQWRHFA